MEEKPLFTFEDFLQFIHTTKVLINTLEEKCKIADAAAASETPTEAAVERLISIDDENTIKECIDTWVRALVQNYRFIVVGFVYYGDAAFVIKSTSMNIAEFKELKTSPQGQQLAEVSRWVITLTTSGVSLITWGLAFWYMLLNRQNYTEDELKLVASILWESLIANVISHLNLHDIYKRRLQEISELQFPSPEEPDIVN